jgi:hypothetical protein
MSDKFEEKAIHANPFDRKRKNWHMWSQKRVARATAKQRRGALPGRTNLPKESKSLDPSKDADKKKVRACALNHVVHSDLLMRVDDTAAFRAADEARADGLLVGDAAKAWKNLVARHEPKAVASMLDLKKVLKQQTDHKG